MMIALLMLSVILKCVTGAYENKGSGACASAVSSPSASDYYYYNWIYYEDMIPSFTQSQCESFCTDQTNPNCIGYSWYETDNGYRLSWNEHITGVDIQRKRKHEKFEQGALQNGQTTTVCNNTIEFHRYYAGINLRIKSIGNSDFTGLFADQSCLNITSKVKN